MTTNNEKFDLRAKAKELWTRYSGVVGIIVPLLIFALGVGFVLYYILGPSKYYMTSDSTDSMRWAQASFESGKLISEDFAYAAILPFGGNLVFLPFIAIFGYSVTAQVAGLAVFAVILAVVMYYMATGIGLGRYGSATLVAIFFLAMSLSPKLREIMWEHIFYYNLGILFFCLGVGITSRLTREDSTLFRAKNPLITLGLCFVPAVITFAFMLIIKKNVATVRTLFISLGAFLAVIILAVVVGLFMNIRLSTLKDHVSLCVLAIFSMLAATDGLQTLVCFALPVCAGVFCERLFDSDEKLFSARNLKAVAVLVAVAFPTLVGYMSIEAASGGVTAGYADAYSSYSAMSSWVNNFLGFFPNWFSLLGVSVAAGDPLASKESILNMLGIFGGIVLLVAPIILLFFWKKIRSHGVRIALVGHFALSAFILFAVTFGKLGGANWRLTPMLGSSVILSTVTALELISYKKTATRFGALLLAVLCVVSIPAALQIKKMEKDTGDNIAWHLAAERLEDEGLRYGYANFWFAESITLFSDGALEVANISEGLQAPKQYVYQINRSAFDDREGEKYFLLLTEKENLTMTVYLNSQKSAGKIEREFTIDTPGYNLRGHSGSVFYVYVFTENIF